MALLSVDEALAKIVDGVVRLGVETVAVDDAIGRVLAEDLVACFTHPPFASSAMDGYAVRASDAAQVGARLSVIGSAQAGRGFGGAIGAGEAVRIFTGAPLPAGADSVIIQEDVRAEDDAIFVREALARDGANVRAVGLDFREGETLLTAGHRLTGHTATLAAAMGYGTVSVSRRPRVALLATGDELVPPGATPGPDQIVSCNPIGLRALIEAQGGVAINLGIARDTREAIASKVEDARTADVLVTIGGASVGDHDLIGPVLKDKGIDLAFWKVAMRPGKPLLFGRLDGLFVMGLPGNPVSALITARVFLRPLLSALQGEERGAMVRERATLLAPIGANGPRLQLMRGKLIYDDGLQVQPCSTQDSSVLSVLAEADCLIIRDPQAPAAAAGETVVIERL